jgi:tetratricopeptide (TPR) repeat protein
MRRQILNAADAGEGDAIVNQLRAQMAADPSNVGLRLELAAHYRKAGLPELEMEHLRLAAERFPDSRAARMALAASLRAAGQPGQAAGELHGFVLSHPAAAADPELLNQMGICYDDAGNWAAGEQAFRQALLAAPRLDYLHNNLGYNLLQQKRLDEAIASFRQALKWNPDSVFAQNNLGVALARLSAKDRAVGVGEALEHFENVVDTATAYNNLAAALIEQERYEESRRLLEAALDYNRSNGAALSNLRLLSALDGKPAGFALRRQTHRWRRRLGLVKRVFVAQKVRPPE